MRVQAAFQNQSAICTRAGAPFTGRLCRLLGQNLSPEIALCRRILQWPANPSHESDALPLRVVGGLHALARSGSRPDWSAVYPPAQAPDDDVLTALLVDVLEKQGAWLDPWLDGPPQTNEVGRSAVLMGGLLVVAARFGLPFALYELGASAGLNSLLDRYSYRLGDLEVGDPASPVRLAPVWTGGSPPAASIVVASRKGVDRNPLDVTDMATRDRLRAYVWADHSERMARLDAALALAMVDPPGINRADASDWLEGMLEDKPVKGICRVVMHTIAYQYFSAEAQQRIGRHMDRVGAGASDDAPLVWLSFEADDSGGTERRPALDMTVWSSSGKETQRLAVAQPHGAQVEWLL